MNEGFKARILVVDDEDAIVDLLRTLLEADGHDVVTENDGDAAVRRVRAERFNLILTDKNLPGSSGIDIIRAAIEADPMVECVLVTGYGSMESAIAAMDAGAFDYILKPFSSLGELRNRVRRALEAHKLKRDNRALGEFLSSVVKNMSACLVVVDRDGSLRAINPPALDVADVSAEDAKEGQPLAAVLGEEVATAFLTPSRRVNNQVLPREITITRRDGKKVGVGFTSTPLVAPDGSANGTIVTFRDLSELKRQQDDERRRDRLAALGEMSARIAHEVRNPLVSIDSVLQLLEDDLGANASAAKDIGTISREVRRLHMIVSEILQFSGRKPSNPVPGDVASLLTSVGAQVQSQFKAKQVALEVAPPSAMALIPFDADRMRQVLLNLLLNALDATPANGSVKLTAEIVADPAIAHSDGGAVAWGSRGEAPGNQIGGRSVRITIDDTGIGLPPEVQSRLFTPFFSTKTRGTGLGLAVCRGIIEEHHGTISITNRTEGGTRAEVVLPA